MATVNFTSNTIENERQYYPSNNDGKSLETNTQSGVTTNVNKGNVSVKLKMHLYLDSQYYCYKNLDK